MYKGRDFCKGSHHHYYDHPVYTGANPFINLIPFFMLRHDIRLTVEVFHWSDIYLIFWHVLPFAITKITPKKNPTKFHWSQILTEFQ